MTIREVEARFKLGSFQFGKKLGNIVEPGEEIVLEEGMDGISFIDLVIDLEKKFGKNINVPDHPNKYGQSALIEDTDSLRLGVFFDGKSYFDTPIYKDDINKHPDLKGKLRWIPNNS